MANMPTASNIKRAILYGDVLLMKWEASITEHEYTRRPSSLMCPLNCQTCHPGVVQFGQKVHRGTGGPSPKHPDTIAKGLEFPVTGRTAPIPMDISHVCKFGCEGA